MQRPGSLHSRGRLFVGSPVVRKCISGCCRRTCAQSAKHATLQTVSFRYHVGMDVGLPVDGSLLLPLHWRSVQLQEARLHDEHATVPLLEDLLRRYSLQNQAAESVVVHEQRRETVAPSILERTCVASQCVGRDGGNHCIRIRVVQRSVHLLECRVRLDSFALRRHAQMR